MLTLALLAVCLAVAQRVLDERARFAPGAPRDALVPPAVLTWWSAREPWLLATCSVPGDQLYWQHVSTGYDAVPEPRVDVYRGRADGRWDRQGTDGGTGIVGVVCR